MLSHGRRCNTSSRTRMTAPRFSITGDMPPSTTAFGVVGSAADFFSSSRAERSRSTRSFFRPAVGWSRSSSRDRSSATLSFRISSAPQSSSPELGLLLGLSQEAAELIATASWISSLLTPASSNACSSSDTDRDDAPAMRVRSKSRSTAAPSARAPPLLVASLSTMSSTQKLPPTISPHRRLLFVPRCCSRDATIPRRSSSMFWRRSHQSAFCFRSSLEELCSEGPPKLSLFLCTQESNAARVSRMCPFLAFWDET
mmetsp:Transcript_42560/g.86052  ORF Transcript_42560/g.86052 Transcript_42560/m.86052 type:complete len:256 (-) Transcript_42560:2446-3213(-)